MRIDLVLLGLLITIQSVFAVVELNVFLIQFMFAPKLRLLCFKYLKSVADPTVLSQIFLSFCARNLYEFGNKFGITVL